MFGVPTVIGHLSIEPPVKRIHQLGIISTVDDGCPSFDRSKDEIDLGMAGFEHRQTGHLRLEPVCLD
jgi:hypothetical protein